MKRTSFQTRLLFGLVLWTGITVCGAVSIHAQTRALKPVRIEAKTAAAERVDYIYAESHALVIGVSEYRNGWSKLPGVKEDVREVNAALGENGFSVTVVEDPGLEELELAIEDFIFEKGNNPDNRLLIYYAGHGHTLKLGYGGDMGYLVPADAPIPRKGRDSQFRRSAMSMQRIEEVAKNTSAKHVLFMLDACFAGSVFLATRAAPAYIELNTKEPVRQFITSGSAEQEVPDQSIFRRAFVDALRGQADYDADGYLTGSELGAYIQKRTAEDWEGRLTPQYGKLQDPNLNKGDFVFELARPEPEVVNAEPEVREEIPEFDLGALKQAQEKLNKLKRAFEQVEGLEKTEGGYLIKVNAWNQFIAYSQSLSMQGSDVQIMLQHAKDRIEYWQQEEEKKLAKLTLPEEETTEQKLQSTENNRKDIDPKQIQPPVSKSEGNLSADVARNTLLPPSLFFDSKAPPPTVAKAPKTDFSAQSIELQTEKIDNSKNSEEKIIYLDTKAKEQEEEKLVLNAMENAFNLNWEAYDSGKLSNKGIVALWHGFLEKYNKNIKSSSLDEKWREQASIAIDAAKKEINLAKNLPSKEDYEKIYTNSRKTIGCKLIDFSCPEPLKFPEFEKSYYLKNYARVKVFADQDEWIDSKITVNPDDVIKIYGSGFVELCDDCGEMSLQARLLQYKIGNQVFNPINFGEYFDKIVIEVDSVEGDLFFRIKDSSVDIGSGYGDNNGYFVLDIFLTGNDYSPNYDSFIRDVFNLNLSK